MGKAFSAETLGWALPSGARWIWTATERANQFVAARATVDLPSGVTGVRLAVFADTKYKLYVNGRFVNAGPAPFWKPVVMVDEHDLGAWVRPGRNTLLVVACFVGHNTKYNTAERPGILACFEARAGKQAIRCHTGGAEWRVAELGCWHGETPRRNWAIEQIEDLDLGHPDFRILARHAGSDYAGGDGKAEPARAWRTPRAFDRPDVELRRRIVPPLAWRDEHLSLPRTIFRGNTEMYNWQDTALRLDHEHAWPEWEEEAHEATRGGTVRFTRREGEPGYLLLYDFRRMRAGDPGAEIVVDRPCTLEFAMAEDLRADGRPIVWRNGGHYYARYHLAAGVNRVRFYHFNGYRYLYLVFKDAVGAVEVRRVTSHNCRADLAYGDAFACEDRTAESLYRICRRSIKLNTQAFAYDCNTREQGTYWGDGIWIVESVGHLTGNFAHLRHLCVAMNDEIRQTGPLLRASLFGMADPLYDYCLVPVEALWRYWRFTGDRATVQAGMATARAIVAQFREYRNGQGLITVANMRRIHGDALKGLLFMDHQGNGWHPMTTVGLDRRDVNAGFNLYYLQALQALAGLERAVGGRPAAAVEREIRTLTETLRRTCLVPSAGLLADAVGEGIAEPRFSQIANALAVTTGLLEGAAARHALRTVLDIPRHPWVSQGTPYSYFFLAEATARCGLAATAVRHFNEAFRGQLERGATTTWEAWRAENHDSRNHAWSAPLPHLVRRGVIGLDPVTPGYGQLRLAPDFAAFDELDATCLIPQGPVHVAWRRVRPDAFALQIAVPRGVKASVEPLSGGRRAVVGTLSGTVTVPG